MYFGFIVNGTPKKQPRRCRRFTAYFGQNWDNVIAAGRFPVLKVISFFFTDLHYFTNEAEVEKPEPIRP